MSARAAGTRGRSGRMALPLSYSLRNVTVRRASALLTALGIALTVAVFAGVHALRIGFEQMYRPRGRGDVALYLRPGATSEGESGFSRERADELVKSRPEIAQNADGRPLAAAESFLAVYMEKKDGGLTNVPLRGIQPMSLELERERLELVSGRWLEFGSDEVVVGEPLAGRLRAIAIGETVTLNVTPFRIVGVYRLPGAQGGEVWGDAERMMAALERPIFQRVVARVRPGTDFEAVGKELEHHPRAPAQFLSERAYLGKQTGLQGPVLRGLARALAVIMGIAAVLGAVNTMLAAVAARTHEIGVLLAIGFPRASVFLAFAVESAVIGIAGGLLGALLVLPFHGLETGMVNWNTFTDVSFSFRVTPGLLAQSVLVAFVLGLVGGALPALRAARLRPVDAVRQQ